MKGNVLVIFGHSFYLRIFLNKKFYIFVVYQIADKEPRGNLARNKKQRETMENDQSCIRLLADKVQIDNCREILQERETAFSRLSDLLALAGNEVRLKILFLLEEEKELCPCDLADILGMSIPAVSQHLRKLKDGNIIIRRREKQTIFYSLKADQLSLLRPFFRNIIDYSRQETV
jgi:DNA-binding transcriptional ArsR family regulator